MKALVTLLVLCCCVTVAMAQGGEVLATAERLYGEGRAAYSDGDYREAERLLRRSIKRYRRVPGYDTLAAFAKTHWRLADTYRHLREHPASLAHYDSAAAYYRRRGDTDAEVYADIDYDRGRVYGQMFRPALAIAAYDRARAAYTEAHGAESAEVAYLLNNVGMALVKAGALREAEASYLEAIDLHRALGTDTADVVFNRLYNNLGIVYRKRGDYDRAVRYAKRALAIKLLNSPPEHPSVGKYYSNIGRALAAQGRYEEALPYMHQSLEHSRASYGERHPSTAGAYGELSNVYFGVPDWDLAERYLRRATRLSREHYPPWHPYRVAGAFNLARLYEETDRPEEALAQYRLALRQIQESPEPAPPLVANAYEHLGKVYAGSGAFPEALLMLDSALAVVGPGLGAILREGGDLSAGEGVHPLYPAPPACLRTLRKVQDQQSVLDVLDDRGLTLLKAERPVEALRTAELAVALVEEVRATFPTESARQFLRGETDDLYRVGVEAAVRLYLTSGDAEYLRRGLRLSDAGKAGSLRDHLREDDLRRLAGVSEADAAHVDRLADAYRAARTGGDEDALDAAAFALQVAREELRRTHPRYAALAAARTPADPELLADRLPAGTVLLDFHFGIGALVATVLTRDTLAARRLPLDTSFEAALAVVGRAPRRPDATVEGRDSVLSALTVLHRALVLPLVDLLPIGATLLVSPDGELHAVPFDLLVRGTGAAADFREADYLLRRHAVGYVAAAGLVDEAGADVSSGSGGLVAFAPDFGDDTAGERAGLGRLPYAQREAAAAARYFSGEVLTGADASVRALRERAPRAGFLHFATHGIVDDGEPLASGLFLSPAEPVGDTPPPHLGAARAAGFLSAAELYGMDLPSALTVLSACHTADGGLLTGEGAMSLARAFEVAGSRSVVASRWLADDRSTAEIVGTFYAHLDGGASRAEALRQAKLAYLGQADAATAHPYYWAGLSLTGASGPVPRDRWTSTLRLGGTAAAALLVLVGGVTFLRSRSRRRRRLAVEAPLPSGATL